MKKIKILFSLLFTFILVFTLIACDTDSNKEKEEQNLSIEDVSLNVNESVPLELSFNAKLKTDFSFTFSNENIIKIEDMVVKGLNPGEVIVTIKDNVSGKEVNVKVVVNDNQIVENYTDTLTFNFTSKNLPVGESFVITPHYKSDSDVSLVWTSSDTNVATVSNGVVTAVTSGVTVIKCVDNNSKLEATCNVTVGSVGVDATFICDYCLSELGTEGYETANLTRSYGNYNCEISYSSSDEFVFSTSDGWLDFVSCDTDVQVTCVVKMGDDVCSKTITYTVIGEDTYQAYEKFASQFKGNRIYESMSINETFEVYVDSKLTTCVVTWTSSDESVFTRTNGLAPNNNFAIHKPLLAQEVVVTYTVTNVTLNTSKEYSITCTVEGATLQDKANYVEEYFLKNVLLDGKINVDTVLPTYIEDYDVHVKYLDPNGNELDTNFRGTNPITDSGYYARVVLSDSSYATSEFRKYFYFDCDYNLTDMWDKVELFLNTIASSKVQYINKGSISAYQSFGYVPFYNQENLDITEDILPLKAGNCRTGITKSSTQYIVVHDTGGSNAGQNADFMNNYIKSINEGGTEDKSWHFTIDEEKCYQHLPLDEVAWHAGDGGREYGAIYFNQTYSATSIGGGNCYGIGIESCIQEGCNYSYTMRRLAKLVAELLIKYNLGFDRIKQHNDFSGKNCPWIMRYTNRWNELIYLIHLEYFAKTELKGVTFEWTSLTEGMDNEGRVTEKLLNNKEINYSCKVKYNGVEKTYNFKSYYNA